MIENWFVLVLMASSVIIGNVQAQRRRYRYRDFDSDSDSSEEYWGYRPRHRFHYEISRARQAVERANDDASNSFLEALQDFSDSQISNSVNISDATANIVRYVRRNPTQMYDVIANLPRLLILDRHKQMMDILNILVGHNADLDHVMRISIENVTNALGGVSPYHTNRRGGYWRSDGPWGSSGIFGGFSRTFRNLMDSTYAVLRPYDSHYNWRDNYY